MSFWKNALYFVTLQLEHEPKNFYHKIQTIS